MDKQIPPEHLARLGLKSSAGPRELNEDNAFIRDYVARAKQQRYLCMGAVADGMGGHQAGEVASQTAIQTLFEEFNALRSIYSENPSLKTEDLLFDLFSSVNSTVYDIAINDNKLEGMGSTLTAFLAEEGVVYIAHVGDSRAYLIRGGSISQLTEDHTLVESMVREGVITREQAAARSDRNVITRAVGVSPTVEIDLFSQPVAAGDIILLCTDGLYDKVSTQDMVLAVNNSPSMQYACAGLVDMAIDRGTTDNVTIILWQVPETSLFTAPTIKSAPGSTATVVLSQERTAVPVPLEAAGGKRPGKALLIITLLFFVIAGFIFGWLIAGWIKNGDSKESQNTEQATSVEQNGNEGDSSQATNADDQINGAGSTAAPLRSSISVALLNPPGKSGPAEEAKQKIFDKGYSLIEIKTANSPPLKTSVYYNKGQADKAKLVITDLGVAATPEVGDSNLRAELQGYDVVVVFSNDSP